MNGFPDNLISYTKSIALGVKELKHLSLSRLRKVFSLMGKTEKITILSLVVVAGLSLTVSIKNFYYQHTTAVAAFGGIYSEGLLGQPTYINPLLATTEPDLSLTRLLFASLYKYDSSGQLVPDLADGMPTISENQKEYTINLRSDAKWHNGQAITADDVIFSLQLIQTPAYKSPLRPLWTTTSIEKLSDYSLKFTTKDISGPFLDNLTLPILPKSVWGSVDAQNFLLSKFNLEAVGSGPYAIKEIKKIPGGKIEQITLQAFSSYYGPQPKISQLIFKFYNSQEDIVNGFHSREIDGFGFVPLTDNLSLDKNQTQSQIISVPLPQYQIVFFNLHNKILTNTNVRRALLLATDKQQIIKQVFNDYALLPVSPWAFNASSSSQTSAPDLNQAQTLLNTGGWLLDSQSHLRANKKIGVFEITITTSDSLANSKAAQILAEQWQKLNIKVNVKLVPAKQLAETVIKPRSFDVLLFPQKFNADPDPFPFWHSTQIKDPGFNLTGFSDQSVDKLINEARTTTDRSLRQQKYQQFNSILTAQVPIIFLDQAEYAYTMDTGVKNVELKTLYDPSQRFSTVSDWYIAEKRIWK